jgi:mannose-1-phosphate guanylyltransferase
MKAILLAAGLGTRLRPLTNSIPKCLVRVNGKALLDYWLDLLLGENAVSRVLINTHWLAGTVCSHIAASHWRDRVDLVHEESLLGTGGTILANRSWFGEAPFIVGHADNLTLFDPLSFRDSHFARPAGAEITMMTFATDDPRSCGIVETDANGVITAFHEKVENPPGNDANAAVYIFEPSVVDFLASLGKPVIDLSTEVLPVYIDRIATFANTGYHRDIGTIASLRKAEQEFSTVVKRLLP